MPVFLSSLTASGALFGQKGSFALRFSSVAKGKEKRDSSILDAGKKRVHFRGNIPSVRAELVEALHFPEEKDSPSTSSGRTESKRPLMVETGCIFQPAMSNRRSDA